MDDLTASNEKSSEASESPTTSSGAEKKKKSTVRTFVIHLGSEPPVRGAVEYCEQLWLMHHYYNAHVAIEHTRRKTVHLARWATSELRALEEQLAPIQQQIDELYRQIKSIRGKAADVKAKKEALDAALKPLNAERVRLLQQAKPLEKQRNSDPEFRIIRDAAKETAKRAWIAARGEYVARGLYWGNYQLVEAAAEQAEETFPKYRVGKRPIPWYEWPRFRQWKREDSAGRVGVQFIKALPTSKVFDVNTQFYLEPLPALPPGVKPSRRYNPEAGIGRTFAWLRVGSTWSSTQRFHKPVWVVVPIALHRPIPTRGTIQAARLQRYHVGTKLRYELHLIICTPYSETARHGEDLPVRRGTVAIDPGWRHMHDGSLRAGYWVDSEGKHDELSLSPKLRARQERVFRLISIRQKNFDEFLPCLVAWADAREEEETPEWFRKATATLALWKHPDRLYQLAKRWRWDRFPADATIFPAVAAWCKQDRHLHDWGESEMDRLLACRNMQYQKWALEFSLKYETVATLNFNLLRVIQKQANGDSREQEASSRRHLVAPGKFRLTIKNAYEREHDGTEIVLVPPEYTTLTCHKCGNKDDFDAAKTLLHTCSQCNETWDQDFNNCMNQLAYIKKIASAPVTTKSQGPLEGGNDAEKKKNRRRRSFRRLHEERRAKDRSQVPGEVPEKK